MGKKKSTEEAPVWPLRRPADNVYEDSDSDKGMAAKLLGTAENREDRAFDNERRSWKRRKEDNYEDVHVSGSPRTQRWYDRRSSPPAADDDYYHRKENRPKAFNSAGTSTGRRHRSQTPEGSWRASREVRGYDRDVQYLRRATYSRYGDDSPRRPNPGNDDLQIVDASDRMSPQRGHGRHVAGRVTGRKQEKMKKPIEVDALGIPFGTMKDQFVKDISAFVKEMNPSLGFDKQKQKAKDCLHERINSEYEVQGDADRVDEKYIKKSGTKALITWRHSLNKAVDLGENKPPELSAAFWEELTEIRKTEASKKKSAQMGNQARNRGLRNSTKEKIRQSASLKLVSHSL
jgi:hypothetical protein